MSKDYRSTLLGTLPLDIKIREQADSGKPTVVAEPDGRVGGDLPGDRAQGRRQIAELARTTRRISQDRRAEYVR